MLKSTLHGLVLKPSVKEADNVASSEDKSPLTSEHLGRISYQLNASVYNTAIVVRKFSVHFTQLVSQTWHACASIVSLNYQLPRETVI